MEVKNLQILFLLYLYRGFPWLIMLIYTSYKQGITIISLFFFVIFLVHPGMCYSLDKEKISKWLD